MLRRLGPLVASASLLLAESAVYDLQPVSGSRFALTVEKTGLLRGKKHLFVFERYSGTLVYDPDTLQHSRVELTIDAASAVCMDAWVSQNDLKKIQSYALTEMLAAERYPQLTFISSGVVRKSEKSLDVPGVLTIRGIARPVAASITLENQPAGPISVAGQAVVKLKDYGLKPPSAALGTIGTRNEMTVEFLLLPSPRSQSAGAGKFTN